MGTERIPVGVSSCLLGNPVRYDGGHKLDQSIANTLADYFDLRPFCPEVGIGLGVPRPPIRLVTADDGPRAVGVRDRSRDVSEVLWRYTADRVPEVARLSGFIFKKGSPSCGMAEVAIYNHSGVVVQRGAGLFAAGIMARFPLLPVEEEGRLAQARLRENFIERVMIYHHWRTRVMPALAAPVLAGFHARLELSLMSRDRDSVGELGRLAASAEGQDTAIIATTARDYIATAMACLRQVPGREGHTDVLCHIRSGLEQKLSADDRAKLADSVDQYRRGEVPLLVPLTLLRHHLRHLSASGLENSWYLAFNPGS